MLQRHTDRIRVGEHERPGQQEVCDTPERVQIGARVDRAAAAPTSGAMYSGVPSVTPSTVK